MARQIDFTKPLSKADQQYVTDRPWLLVDAKLRGELDEDADVTTEADEQDDEEESYEDFTVDQLKAEIEHRNSEREDSDDHIVPEGTRKAELIAALEADDEDDDQPEE